MKKFPKLVQCDKRGQIVIPKEVRYDLGIEEGTGFFVYVVTDEGILLKKIDEPKLDDNERNVVEIKDKAEKIGVKKENVEKTVSDYKKTSKGGFDLI